MPQEDAAERSAIPAPGRSTRQRAAVTSLLDETEDFVSAQQLHDRLRHRGDNVGLTTVYRTLQSLAGAGWVDMVRPTEGESVSRRCASPEHHHPLVCRSCGNTVEVDGPAVESWTT